MGNSIFEIITIFLIIVILLLALWRINIRKLKTYPSKFGDVTVYKKYNGERLLAIKTYEQGVSIEKSSIKRSYWYKVAEETVKFCEGREKPQVLMLGLGANTVSNLITKMNPQIHLTIVEINEAIIDACKDYFDLDNLPKLTLIKADAYQLIPKDAFKQKFDCIIVDIFTGNPPFISLKSNKQSFIKQVIKYLKQDGQIIFNRPAHTADVRKEGEKLRNYLKTLFKETSIFDIKDPRRYRNHIITASLKIS